MENSNDTTQAQPMAPVTPGIDAARAAVDAKTRELREKLGDVDIATVQTKYGCLYFRTPTQGDHERWLEKVASDKGSKAAHTREYVLSALVFPTRDEAAGIFSKLGALPPKIAEKLAEMAGTDVEIEIKKA